MAYEIESDGSNPVFLLKCVKSSLKPFYPFSFLWYNTKASQVLNKNAKSPLFIRLLAFSLCSDIFLILSIF